jgi:hypothetical protein
MITQNWQKIKGILSFSKCYNLKMQNPDQSANSKPKQLSLGAEFDVLHKINKGHLESMSPVYQAAHKKAVELVDGKRIHLDDFNYADTEADKKSVAQKHQEINSRTLFRDGEAEAVVQAEILEAMIYDLVRNQKWFGANASAILPSAYDDLFLGNDMILEHKHEGLSSYSGVGIDITIGETSFMNKVADTKARIRKGQLGRVKYFKSEDANYVGALNNIAHFVIGVDRDQMFSLTKAWVEDDKATLKNSPIKKNLIMMMLAECDEFSVGAPENVRDAYVREKKVLEKLLKSL